MSAAGSATKLAQWLLTGFDSSWGVELRPSLPYWTLAEVFPEFLVAEVFPHDILLHPSQEEIESVSKTRVIISCSLMTEVAPSQRFHILLVRTNYSEEQE